MYILGINNGGESSVVLFKNNKVLFASSEERFSRIKNDTSFPINSLKWILKEAKISKKDIEIVCYGFTDPESKIKNLSWVFNRMNEYNNKEKKIILERISTEKKIDDFRYQEFINYFNKFFKYSKLEIFNHHECHIASALFFSKFDKSYVITADGRGDFKSLTFNEAKGFEIKEIYHSFSWESLGYFYGRITKLCRFIPNRHEGKVTGLSAHGNPKNAMQFLNKMIEFKRGKIRTKLGDYYLPFFSNFSKKLTDSSKKYKIKDIAAAAQLLLEKIVIKILRSKEEKKNICLAGGVFSNVRLNQKIYMQSNIKEIFIFPNMGDGGISFGAVANFLKKKKKLPILKNYYLGKKISKKKLLSLSKKYKYNLYKPKNMFLEVSKLILKKKIIGICHGRAEFGPRALGNRSIICLANNKFLLKRLNFRLKRNDFMPFGPVIISYLADKCLKNFKKNISSRHMTLTYYASDYLKKESPGIIHIDGTIRPQIVYKNDNPFLYNLLDKLYKKYSIPCLVNTSFNVHETPIVNSELDALSCLKQKAIDFIVSEDILISLNKNK